MGCDCNKDIITLHAELIHKARDIQFQIAYDNAGNPATIIDIGKRNVQFALESYWAKVGIPRKNIIPGGVLNNSNLLFTTPEEFIPGTLEVFLSDFKLNGNQADPERDYTEFVTNNGFQIHLDPSKSYRLNSPPKQFESLHVNYSKRITFDTKGGT